MGRRGYPPEFRRKVLDLVEAGLADRRGRSGAGDQRPVDLHLASPGPHRPGPVARPEQPRARRAGGRPPSDRAAGDRAGGHAPCRRAAQGASAPFRRFAAIQVMAEEKLPVQVCWRVSGSLESGFYAWRSRPPSARAIRPCLADRCHPPSAHRLPADLRQPADHAELTLGRGISVGFHAVELLMRRAGLQGVTGRPKYRRGLRPEATARDLVQRPRVSSASIHRLP